MCIKCRNKLGKEYSWKNEDTYNWKIGIVKCYYKLGENKTTITYVFKDNKTEEQPDNDCPYKLEHIVSNQNAE